jgi:hypothetical protein
VAALDRHEWLVHGFGTRHSDVAALAGRLATVKQVHSAECVAADGRGGVLGEADALLENTPGCAVAVKTADCIPILLVDPGQRAVAAVHAGWRGTAARIAEKAVAAMRQRFGTDPAVVEAAIGPGIGVCCYEVGPEVAARFGHRGRAHIDLAQANRAQLEAAGIGADRIHCAGLCTMCNARDFHSFRRDGEAAGRMYSFIGVK